MAFIKSIEINQFRGIQRLAISDFSNINLIVGDNNSGKTTFLEAIQLLFAKSQLSSIELYLLIHFYIFPEAPTHRWSFFLFYKFTSTFMFQNISLSLGN